MTLLTVLIVGFAVWVIQALIIIAKGLDAMKETGERTARLLEDAADRQRRKASVRNRLAKGDWVEAEELEVLD